VKDKKSLTNIVKLCSKITGTQLNDLTFLWETRAVKKAERILCQPDHALSEEFVVMQSGRRYYVPKRKTNRYANSFIQTSKRKYINVWNWFLLSSALPSQWQLNVCECVCVWVCVILVGKLVSKHEDVSIYFFYSLCVTEF